jgi:hypothetical protein
MIQVKFMLYVLLVVFVIQADYSIGKLRLISKEFSIDNLGLPLKHGDLQLLVMKALKTSDCARVVPVPGPLPLRFRRSTNQKTFRCIFTLD